MSFMVNVSAGRLSGAALGAEPSMRSMLVARAMRVTPVMRIAVGTLAAIAFLSLSACSGGKNAVAPPALVVALPVHPDTGAGAGGGAIRYPVEVAARYSNPMSFRVPGKLMERKVRIGDTVKKGEIVAQLDPIDAQRQAASAKATLDAAEHRLLFAKQQLDRDSAQSEQNLIAANQLEQTQDTYSAAQAGREQAAAQWVVARNNLEYNTLIADHDGVITSENADTGQVVSAGQAVYGLAWSGDIDVTLDAAASDLGRIAVGQTASVTFPALPGRRFDARVREITPAADPQSRTYRVKLTLTQPGQVVRLGMTGDATLSPVAGGGGGATEVSFTLPTTAIFHQGNAPAVWVIVPGTSTLELRPVTVRGYSDHSTTISGGLKDGETVVLAGVHTVYAGERVSPVRPLFDGEGDVAGPAPAGNTGVTERRPSGQRGNPQRGSARKSPAGSTVSSAGVAQ
ncbi:MAG: multidrug efflux pump, rane fusion protein CzcB subfamily [Gammaproteobacteria bacterium]|nr:multidrug efflux pump, rane fusion protein CzcB subfamily [Gammaproteobacteria bacterium]